MEHRQGGPCNERLDGKLRVRVCVRVYYCRRVCSRAMYVLCVRACVHAYLRVCEKSVCMGVYVQKHMCACDNLIMKGATHTS